MTGTLDTLLARAVRAPSGTNTQPWRFVVDDEARTIALDLDPARDPSPMNAGQRMARIALGPRWRTSSARRRSRLARRVEREALPLPGAGPPDAEEGGGLRAVRWPRWPPG
jgi:nitroreductase